ncbi:hypothetical protein EIP91_001662 [Steccherinum ochraceum]|uniref:Uncharacterized protein n=1 Tax=Steccherinum ochraceum TaxID=92696 RepID=A0A4R0RJY1_9APHY|nr:hypothetical protein EIP91_001662 [Steccherinum ochraceum]
MSADLDSVASDVIGEMSTFQTTEASEECGRNIGSTSLTNLKPLIFLVSYTSDALLETVHDRDVTPPTAGHAAIPGDVLVSASIPGRLALHKGGISSYTVSEFPFISQKAVHEINRSILPSKLSLIAVKVKNVIFCNEDSLDTTVQERGPFTREQIVDAIRPYLEHHPASEKRWYGSGTAVLIAQSLRMPANASGHSGTIADDDEVYIAVLRPADDPLQPFMLAAVLATLPLRAGSVLTAVNPDVQPATEKQDINSNKLVEDMIQDEELYLTKLSIMETTFIDPLNSEHLPAELSESIEDIKANIFGNILEIRKCSQDLLQFLRVQGLSVTLETFSRTLLDLVKSFRTHYPTYSAHCVHAVEALKRYSQTDPELDDFFSRQTRSINGQVYHLKDLLELPLGRIQAYSAAITSLLHDTPSSRPGFLDLERLAQALDEVHSLSLLRQYQTYPVDHPIPRTARGWMDLAPRSISDGLTEQEKEHQQLLFELIHSEREHVNAMQSIEKLFLAPLRDSQDIFSDPERWQHFKDVVFPAFTELCQNHLHGLAQMQNIQYKEWPVVQSVVVALQNLLVSAEEAYIANLSNQPIDDDFVDCEIKSNRRFRKFCESISPSAGDADSKPEEKIKQFLSVSRIRIARYASFLNIISSKASDNRQYQESILLVLRFLEHLESRINHRIAFSQSQVSAWSIGRALLPAEDSTRSLELESMDRFLVHEGQVGLDEASLTSDLHAFLFDHILLLTVMEESPDGLRAEAEKPKYRLQKRAIPLELLRQGAFTDPPQQIKRTSFDRLRGIRGERTTSTTDTIESRTLYPFGIFSLAREGGVMTLFAESEEARSRWREKLGEAVEKRKAISKANAVFDLSPLISSTFRILDMQSQPARGQGAKMGNVTCSVVFTTVNGQRMLAIGTDKGIYLGLQGSSETKHVLKLSGVTQCAVIIESDVLLALAEKSLFAFPIETLVAMLTDTTTVPATDRHRLGPSKGVSFFQVGRLKVDKQERSTIIYVVHSSNGTSDLVILEPVATKRLSEIFRSSQRTEWVKRVSKKCILQYKATDFIILQGRPVILSIKGFDMYSLDMSGSFFVPFTASLGQDTRSDKLAKRLLVSKPIGLFQTIDEEFLLCYEGTPPPLPIQ